jgi:hypothetical protein
MENDLTPIVDAAMDGDVEECAKLVIADMQTSGEDWGAYISLVETVEDVTDEFLLELTNEIKNRL